MIVTDEMVRRAAKHLRMTVTGYAYDRHGKGDYTETHDPHPDQIRRALDAALNAPAEPEIVVTREMADAGGKEYKFYRESEYRAQSWSVNDFATCIYRAMRKLEPKAEGPSGADKPAAAERRKGCCTDGAGFYRAFMIDGKPYWIADRRAGGA